VHGVSDRAGPVASRDIDAPVGLPLLLTASAPRRSVLSRLNTRLLAKARRGSSVVDAGTALPDDLLIGHDLVSVFQVGWTVLHDDVCMYTAERLIGVLTRLQCDHREIQAGLDALRIELARHWQVGARWRARTYWT